MNDLRLAIRQLLKSPGYTAIAGASLALGIGAGTAVFSLVNAILLRSLPVPNPHELRVLQWAGTDVRMTSYTGSLVQAGHALTHAESFTHPAFLALREEAGGVADVFGFEPLQAVAIRVRDETFVEHGMMVSDNFFATLGVRPLIGRLLTAEEDFGGGQTNTVISHEAWRRHFNLDPQVLGRTVGLNGTAFTVVGVLPAGFTGVQPGSPRDFYVPMAQGSPFLYRPITESFHWFVRLMARLRPGFSDAQLNAALDVAFSRDAEAIMKHPGLTLEPGRGGLAYDRSHYRKPLLLMFSIVGLVMLAGCANLAGLSLARGAGREHELSVRSALGAGGWRLFRQSLVESLVLAFLGGGAGVLLALWGRTALARLLAGTTEGLHYDLSLDLTVLGFSVVAALITTLLAGLLPAGRAARADPVNGLKSRGRIGSPRLRAGRALVAAQVCVSLLLLTGAGLYVRTLLNLTRIDAGFGIERLLLVTLNIKSGDQAEARPAQFYERVQEAVAALPGVRAATLVEFPMLRGDFSQGSFMDFKGRATDPSVQPPMQTYRVTVSESFFATLGIPILRGRGIEAADGADTQKVVVVNERFVRDYLPDVDPIGAAFNTWDADWRIVGVSRDARSRDIKEPVQPTAYFPYRQRFYSTFADTHLRSVSIAARTALPPLALSTAVRKAVAEIDPGVAIAQVTTQEALRDRGISRERMVATLCASLAGLAVLLSCIGLYGLMAYDVTRRTDEIGIRMALGATRRDIAVPILRESALLAGIGVVAGGLLALALSRLIQSQLYGVEPNDPLSLGAASLGLLLVAIVAAWIPARRAAKVDPMTALRAE